MGGPHHDIWEDTVPLKTQCSPLTPWVPGKNTKVEMQVQLQGGTKLVLTCPLLF